MRGPKRARMALALQHQLNIFGYHLPLDAHPVLGNNAQLAPVLGFEVDRDADGNPVVCGPEGLVWLGRCTPEKTLAELGNSICNALQRQPLIARNTHPTIRRITWCTADPQRKRDPSVGAGREP